MNDSTALVPAERIELSILLIRGHKVIIDADLALLYGVETRALVQAVKRNTERFPEDFMFRLTVKEAQHSRSQSVILNAEHTGIIDNSRSQSVILKQGKNIKHLPYAFTEQGVAMLSSVLRSPRAVQVNIEIMRAFVRLREMMSHHKGLAVKLAELEHKVSGHDQSIEDIFDAIRQLMAEPETKKRRIGFGAKDE